MHGGLSPDLNSMEQIRRVMRPTDVSQGILPLRASSRTIERGPELLLINPRFLTVVCFATSSGLTQTRISLDGAKMTVVYHSPSGPTSYLDSYRSMIWI